MIDFDKYFILNNGFFWFCFIMTIVSVIMYAIEPTYNVVDKSKTKTVKQSSRTSHCRMLKVIAVDPPQKPKTSRKSSQKQTLTIELPDKSTRTYANSSREGYDVNDTILYNIIDSTKCYGSTENDKVTWEDKSTEYVSKDEKVPGEKTLYFDKHGNLIYPGSEYTNGWLWSFIAFLIIVLIYVGVQGYSLFKKPSPK